MKIKEIANSEEQVGLLKLIMDKTWEAIAHQATQQPQAVAQRRVQAKRRPVAVRSAIKAVPAVRAPAPSRPVIAPVRQVVQPAAAQAWSAEKRHTVSGLATGAAQAASVLAAPCGW